MLKLNKLPSLLKKRKRVGRGGKLGGTAGRGHKGQRARSSGNVRAGFEGGQMPLYRRLPKRGFNNKQFQKDIQVVNLARLDVAFEIGTEITKELLVERGIVKPRKSRKGQELLVKVLGTGTLTKRFIIHADAFSASAAQAIVSQGGEARLIKEK